MVFATASSSVIFWALPIWIFKPPMIWADLISFTAGASWVDAGSFALSSARRWAIASWSGARCSADQAFVYLTSAPTSFAVFATLERSIRSARSVRYFSSSSWIAAFLVWARGFFSCAGSSTGGASSFSCSGFFTETSTSVTLYLSALAFHSLINSLRSASSDKWHFSYQPVR